MFKSEVVLICRKCLTPFCIPGYAFNDAVKAGAIKCPTCGLVTAGKGTIERFFRYYPRLVAAQHRIGSKVIAYEIAQFRDQPVYEISSLIIKCGACSKNYPISMSRVDKLAQLPGSHICPRCKAKTAHMKEMKEFFISLKQVKDSSGINCREFQWDIFTPLKLDPKAYKLQWPRYENVAPQ